ncbi:hypothetical protein TNCT_347011 [Trichonephila clavata]|uniref:Uncharacterized protein n=1 Tax=Trichonephila clavata TaxID=2740835 RepID=A0A8X6H0A4_TRICU|nr:hypothetical protein TNCT_347011 [Trichonephila clavata]
MSLFQSHFMGIILGIVVIFIRFRRKEISANIKFLISTNQNKPGHHHQSGNNATAPPPPEVEYPPASTDSQQMPQQELHASHVCSLSGTSVLMPAIRYGQISATIPTR